ncbi:MAG: hypothetical protein KBE04_15450, partial [Phycisphaerae bacterium]|nr:hypothetical protein [Phycisphaerae bacterium]
MVRQTLFVVAAVAVCAAYARAEVSIPVENYSFELPGTGKPSIDQKGTVPGWAKTEITTQSGVEQGWTPTHGRYTAYMGLDAEIYNTTGFLALEGDQFQLVFDARSTWQANLLRTQLYYLDGQTRVVFASSDIDLTPETPPAAQNAMRTLYMDSNVVGPELNDRKVGIQFKHVNAGKWDTNIWCGLDFVELRLLTPLKRAQTPSPVHEGFVPTTEVPLAWVPGPNAPAVERYRVYLSADRAQVEQGSAQADKGEVTVAGYTARDLEKGGTYYWRVDSVLGAETFRGNVWQFSVTSTSAYHPDPARGETYVALDKVLTWSAGSGSLAGHVVFFGEDFDAVANAPVGLAGPAPFRALLEQTTDTAWSPAAAGLALETSKTYYWRVDEVEDSESPGVLHKGDVWSFTTVPIKGLGSIVREVWEDVEGTAVADLTADPNYPDRPDALEVLKKFAIEPIGILNYGSRTQGWLYVRAPGEYTFWIASGENSELWFGDHPSTASLIARVDDWTEPQEWGKFPETQQSQPVSLEGGGAVYYIMALHKKGTAYENLAVAWSGPDTGGERQIIPGTSLIPFSEVVLLEAAGPRPTNHAADVEGRPTLAWVAGPHAASHQVYLGTDAEAVEHAGPSSPEYQGMRDLGSEVLVPGRLAFETAYYWRVDEVNAAHPDGVWPGKVWTFTTGNFLVVDDFEGYDDLCNRVFFSWLSGAPDNGSQDPNCPKPAYAGNGTSSTVGNYDPPFAERTTVHLGRQAMPFWYDNTAGPFYSETQQEWSVPQSWTDSGVNALTVYLRGDAPAFLETASGTILMNGTGADIWGTTDQLRFAYRRLTGNGSITAKVEGLTDVDTNAKAGVMIRETLNDYSMHALVNVTPGAGLEFIRRPTTVGESTSAVQAGLTAPYWVRLTRSGETFTAECSADGV